MEKCLRTPAKINLCLHVLKRRQDGYHELAMAMQQVSLFDEVGLRIGERPGIRVTCPRLSLSPGEENIAARAARLLLTAAGQDLGVDIVVTKQIPVAAGLGGGSSDAAAVLLGLNELLGYPVGESGLAELAARLGADVPFFLQRDAAWATGIGTRLEPLGPLPKVAYLLVNPGMPISTAQVYRSLQLTRSGKLANLQKFSVTTRTELCARLHNDLESVVLPQYPEVAAVKQALLHEGARGALMSGSGATVFGVYDSLEAAARVAGRLNSTTAWWAAAVEPLGAETVDRWEP